MKKKKPRKSSQKLKKKYEERDRLLEEYYRSPEHKRDCEFCQPGSDALARGMAHRMGRFLANEPFQIWLYNRSKK